MSLCWSSSSTTSIRWCKHAIQRGDGIWLTLMSLCSSSTLTTSTLSFLHAMKRGDSHNSFVFKLTSMFLCRSSSLTTSECLPEAA
mmetsp:Transcript_34999/g.45122  ORF Transcript_34999/g.45122 Transcript_34999/m.45122 type:complete len:85 (+) Transcript_34999:322-576(+)